MSIKLFCLLKGNTPAVKHAFEVVIEADKSVSALKEVIKAKKAPRFDDIPADELKLWKVEIPDDRDSELADPALNDELLATRDVEDYWTEKPPKRHIHVIVEPPVQIASSSREQELLNRIASLEASINKSVHGAYMYKISWQKPFPQGTIRLYSEKRFFTNHLLCCRIRCCRKPETDEGIQVDSEY